MGWFGDQIELRKKKDRELLSEGYAQLGEAVTGKKRSSAQESRLRESQNIIDEILDFFHFPGTEISEQITDLEERFETALRPHGILWRKVALRKGWYRNSAGLLLGRKKEDGGFVVLIPDRIAGYHFSDRKTGKIVRLNRNTEQLLMNDAYCFSCGFPKKSLGIPDLIRYITKSIPTSTYLFLLAISLLIAAIGMLIPRMTYLVYTDVIVRENLRLLLAVAAFAICMGLGTILLKVIRDIVSARLDTQLNMSVEASIMERIMSMPVDFFKDYSTGELANRMKAIREVCTTLFAGIFTVGAASVFSLLYLIQIRIYAGSLLVPAILITLVTMIHTMLVIFLHAHHRKDQMEQESKNQGLLYGMTSGIQKIKLSGSEKRVFAKWMRQYSNLLKLNYQQPFFLKYSDNIASMIGMFGQILMYYLAWKHSLTVPEFLAFESAYGLMTGSFLSLVRSADMIAGIFPVLEMAEPIMKLLPENSEEKKIVSKVSGNIELDRVNFRYKKDEPYILRDFSVKIKSGEYVAVVGKSGCGKTTLVRLLLGFEKPDRGAVYYDGKDLNSLELKSLRRNIGTVIQNAKLFPGDILSNITIASGGASIEDAWRAAEIAQIDKEIRSMPRGMHTRITEGNGSISGGQKQKLLIARAVAGMPKILILDEATSALDNITQKKISDSLDQLHCTRIVIAHRLSTIRHCDRILYLEDGTIAEEGSYEELIARGGKFADLVAGQQI